jgi:hypothetical protein
VGEGGRGAAAARERHALQVARQAEEHGVAGGGVDAGDDQRVRPGALTAVTRVGTDEQYVHPRHVRPGVGGGGRRATGAARQRGLARGEDRPDGVPRHQRIARTLRGRHDPEQGEDRDEADRERPAGAGEHDGSAQRGVREDDESGPGHGERAEENRDDEEPVGTDDGAGGRLHRIAPQDEGGAGEQREDGDAEHDPACRPSPRNDEAEAGDQGAEDGPADQPSQAPAAGRGRITLRAVPGRARLRCGRACGGL